MGRTLFPEAAAVRLRPGTKARMERLCAALVTTPSDWMRSTIERALETDERRLRAQAQREREAQR